MTKIFITIDGETMEASDEQRQEILEFQAKCQAEENQRIQELQAKAAAKAAVLAKLGLSAEEAQALLGQNNLYT